MRWERFAKNCAFAVILFLLVNALQAVRLPGTEVVRSYLAFAFTTDWDYQNALSRAQRGIRTLASYTGRLGRPAPEAFSPAAPAPAVSPASPAPVFSGDAGAGGAAASPARESPAPGPSGTPPKLSWPVRGWVSERFGRRQHPIYRLAGPHEGIDVAAAQGAPVTAPAAGRVSATFRGLTSGLTVELAHDGFTTRYLHLSAIKVRPGETVKAGTVVGLVGNTGVSTGPHLHFEVRVNGQPVDPLPLLPR